MIKELLPPNVPILLDGKPVEQITAFLVDKGGNDDPHQLLANEGKSFQGSYVLGMGFTFDDTNPNATPIAEMHRLIEENPKNQECIFPYIGGEEVNKSPTHAYYRYVINFGEMSEEEAREYPELMAIIEEKVKPSRINLKGKPYREKWWQYAEKQLSLYDAIAQRDQVLVSACGATKYLAFAFLPANCVFSHALAVFPLETYSEFAILQSRIHKHWARFFSSSMKDDLRYTPSDCFQTFPFPKNWETDPTLEQIGETYYTFRANLMERNNEGLTDTYNRFHNPDETDSDILQLRQLHDQLDQAVFNAYGWDDLTPTCDFLLDYEEDDDTSNRKKPWRYRWNDEFQDEILARLLDLNKQRHEEEVLRGEKGKKTTKSRGRKKKQESSNSLDLDYS
ncbi:hypothetical protein PCC7418_1673 [Halothece sp. PCC 7418]|uniref:type IIL restriction-modification enzyme MmeI n=1 Tax=Halothece sp. (strain PCC 7418) TaxID=65093 RepID=UPI0002A08685|nr:type IIL restriction-modification enzyme MmeI [Halothece sp. PCC 7418]AFZ43851.1 hypothetical protein PCC7418_1673 [Halothece sp. PCC 7418]